MSDASRLMTEDIEPLSPVLWFQSFEVLRARLEQVWGLSPESHLRHAYHLLQLAPIPLRNLLQPEVTEAEYESLLAAERFDAASIALLGPGFGYQVYREAGETSTTAVLALASTGSRGTATSTTLAMAILPAFCDTIRALGIAAQGQNGHTVHLSVAPSPLVH